jgi:hypothetical protein
MRMPLRSHISTNTTIAMIVIRDKKNRLSKSTSSKATMHTSVVQKLPYGIICANKSQNLQFLGIESFEIHFTLGSNKAARAQIVAQSFIS